jgi:putative serine/threonine protein kinase
MPTSTIVSVQELCLEPYISVVCYPKGSATEIKDRVNQLEKLNVQAVEFSGKSSAFKLAVVGKGYVGIVAVARLDGQRLALKMRRSDADRKSLEQEAELLQIANSVDVGPKFLGVSKDFLLMQLVEGDLFEAWLETQNDKQVIAKVLVEVLEQCWRLDQAGLDHGELSKAPKHLLINKANKPFIVDFETASLQRKVANVTAICQYLFQGNSQAKQLIAQKLGVTDSGKLVTCLKEYKKRRTRSNFEGLLQVSLKGTSGNNVL